MQFRYCAVQILYRLDTLQFKCFDYTVDILLQYMYVLLIIEKICKNVTFPSLRVNILPNSIPVIIYLSHNTPGSPTHTLTQCIAPRSSCPRIWQISQKGDHILSQKIRGVIRRSLRKSQTWPWADYSISPWGGGQDFVGARSAKQFIFRAPPGS